MLGSMTKGVSIKLTSYEETIPKLFKLIKFDQELKRHEAIVLKPCVHEDAAHGTPLSFVEEVVKFCAAHKNPGAEVYIAEGADGADTSLLFEEQGYRALAEKYNVSLIDLNNTESESIGKNEFVGFEQIMYPSILKHAFVVSLPVVKPREDVQLQGALTSMLGAFPARHYKGFFSQRKNKLDAYPLKYQVHDINLCKMPNFALLELRDKGVLLAGHPLEMDKQAAKLLGMDWRSIGYLRMLDETLESIAEKQELAEQHEAKAGHR